MRLVEQCGMNIRQSRAVTNNAEGTRVLLLGCLFTVFHAMPVSKRVNHVGIRLLDIYVSIGIPF